MTKLEIAFAVILFAVALISFLQSHWLIALLIAGLLGVVLWVMYALLSNLNYLVIPVLVRF